LEEWKHNLGAVGLTRFKAGSVVTRNCFQQLPELPAGPQQEFDGMFNPGDWAGTGLNIN
jgi:hypothetical protein